MNVENIKAAGDYESLKVQFAALKRMLASQQAQLTHYQKRVSEFSVERTIQLEAELESEREMNSMLTAELEQLTKSR